MTMRVIKDAKIDQLTHCYIKEHLIPTLRELKDDYDLTKRPFSILIFDIDHFKSFNDKHGHIHGDEVLKYFSSSLHLNLVDEDNIPFRFGGDEFIVVFPGKGAVYCHELAKTVQRNIRSRMFLLKGKQYQMSFSGGVTTYPDDAKTAETLLDKADQALYCSKKNGRARTTRYNQIFFERVKYFFMLGLMAGAVVLGAYFYRQDLGAVLKYLRGTRITFHSGNAPQNPPPLGYVPRPISEPPPPPLPRDPAMDEITLRSGDILMGHILVETGDEIIINMKLGHGEGKISVKRSEILKLRKAQA